MIQKETRIVRSRETGKQYRVVREYLHCLMVTPADRKRATPFTLPRSAFISSCGGGRMQSMSGLAALDTIEKSQG